MTPTKLKTSKNSGHSRRNFLATTAGGFTLSFFLPTPDKFAEAAVLGGGLSQVKVNSYIRISPDNTVTVMFGGCELGQGTMSGLAQIVAEDLRVDWSQIRVEQALGDANPGTISYGTGGSSGVRSRFRALRLAGATAKDMLLSAAVVMGGGKKAMYSASNCVVTGNGKSFTYAQLASTAAAQPVPTVPPPPDGNFRIIGTTVPRVDIPLKVNGSAVYGIDVKIPEMVYASVKHCPTIGGTVKGTVKTPQSAIAAVPLFSTDNRGVIIAGVAGVGPYYAVGVVVDGPNANTWAAVQAAQSIQVSWTIPAASADIDSAKIATAAAALMTNDVLAVPAESAGDTIGALASAAKIVDATYTLPYLAHACMEVVNCTVNLTATSCEMWAPTQSASGAVKLISTLTGLPYSAITVHTTFLGGGLGRKIELDFVSQAVQIAMAVKKPVKLVWPRSEDFTHDLYRPAAFIHVKAGVTGNSIRGWNYRTVTQSIAQQRGRPGLDGQAVEGAVKLHYTIPDRKVDWVPHPVGLPVGYWRSVGASLNCFAVESMIDELALAAGIDPIQFRQNLMGADPRAKAVVDTAAQKSLWRLSLPKGHAWGVAFGESFATQVCHVVEISAPTASSITVHRVTTVLDCGIAVNPGQIEAQMQGGIVHGMSAALYGQITFTSGVPGVTNFNKYRMVRPHEMPTVDVTILQYNLSQVQDPAKPLPIGGIGEPGVPPIAPAIANAYFKLTGKRVRNLPFFPGSTMSDG